MLRVRNVTHPAGKYIEGRETPREQPKHWVRVYTGDVVASSAPCGLDALLGSCVAVCLFDPLLLVGGMNHILLSISCDGCHTRGGVQAMELLINELMKLGGNRRSFVAKAFGGANVVPALRNTLIGDENVRFIRRFLAAERIPLIAEKLGGDRALHVRFKTDTGKAMVRVVRGPLLPKIVHAEDKYWRTHRSEMYPSGEITLF